MRVLKQMKTLPESVPTTLVAAPPNLDSALRRGSFRAVLTDVRGSIKPTRGTGMAIKAFKKLTPQPTSVGYSPFSVKEIFDNENIIKALQSVSENRSKQLSEDRALGGTTRRSSRREGRASFTGLDENRLSSPPRNAARPSRQPSAELGGARKKNRSLVKDSSGASESAHRSFPERLAHQQYFGGSLSPSTDR
jgi:hypothetical protein